MKAIIYAGIGLFAAASVYGAADLYNSQQKGTLSKLYKDEATDKGDILKENVTSVVIPVKNTEVNATEAKMNTAQTKATKKIRPPKRTIRMEDFSRSRIVQEPPIEVEKPLEVIAETTPQKEETATVINKPVTVKRETQRKINLDMFSRAPLRKPVKTTLIKN